MKKYGKPEVFIWTEAINCGELLKPFILSYLAHHSLELHVFGTKSDLDFIKDINHPKIIRFNVSQFGFKFEKKLLKHYRKGHKGTSYLWANIIESRTENYFIHLDADTIFVKESISGIINKLLVEKYALVGSRRPYKLRSYRKTGLDGQLLNLRPDVVNTDCFGFDKNFVRLFPINWLRRKIEGRRCSIMPVVDFFDPISFEIIRRNGKIFYMDSLDVNSIGLPKPESDFCSSRISFSAVGSGINFYKNPETRTSPGYREFALSSYALYSKWILRRDLDIPVISAPELESKLSRLDTEMWRLSL